MDIALSFSIVHYQLNKMEIWGIIKIIFRNIFVQRGFSLVTLIGLSLGIAMTLLVLAYADYERSYDKHFPDSENIYRFMSNGSVGDDTLKSALSSYPLVAVANQTPDVIASTRILPADKRLVSSDYARYNESKFFYADDNVFEVFQIPFLLGNPATSLADSNSIVISQTMSRKYFENENPIGQELSIDQGIKFKVTGVFLDFPDNTHIHPDFISSWNHIKKNWDENYPDWEKNWFALSLYTYMRVSSDAEFSSVANHIDSCTSRLMQEYIVKKGLENENIFVSIQTQPVESIHLTTGIDHEIEEGYNSTYIRIFTGIAFLILFITAINFMNLVTAKVSRRSKEIAVRKTFGAGKQHIGIQLLLETVILSFTALVFALVLMEIFAFRLSDILDIRIGTGAFVSHINIKSVILVTLFLGLLAGSYPALFFSKNRPDHVFRNNIHFAKSGIFIRGVLLAFQVCIAVSLMSISFGAQQQISHLRTVDSGYNPNQILVIERGYVLDSEMDSTRMIIEKMNEVESVSSIYVLPDGEIPLRSIKKASELPSTGGMMLATLPVDSRYLSTLGAKLTEGRFFEENDTVDKKLVVINESAAKSLGIDDIKSQQLEAPSSMLDSTDNKMTIIGIINDIHTGAITEQVKPTLYYQISPNPARKDHLYIRIKPKMYEQAIAKIGELYNSAHYADPFVFYPLNDKLKEFYRKEIRFTGIDILFSVLTIVFSILGVIGFVSFVISSRRKNMEIRKIITNSPTRILFATFKGLLLYIISGIICSFFISFYILKMWLSGFYTAVIPSVLCYLIPALVIFVLLMLVSGIVGYRALKFGREW